MPVDVTLEEIGTLFQDTGQGFRGTAEKLRKTAPKFRETDHSLDRLEAIVTRTNRLVRLIRY